MKNLPTCGLHTRSLEAAQPVDINALLRESIKDQIDCIIRQHPNCPAPASAAVDALLQTVERVGHHHDL
ncbi:MAG: hypothetical protein FJ333_04465 [Sphingomonadales bacterium]|nr:hypothetical protein [Sphingomonadales bacterium]